MSSDDETYSDPIFDDISGSWYCRRCMKLRVKINDGRLACPECDDVQDGVFVTGHRDSTVKPKKKSEHSRVTWMRNRLSGLTKGNPDPIVESRFVDGLAHDFSLVEKVLRDKGLVKGRNISRYDYYIVRLCSRVGTRPLTELKDLKAGGKARTKADNDLYGVVYPELGWGDESDEYYRRWLSTV